MWDILRQILGFLHDLLLGLMTMGPPIEKYGFEEDLDDHQA